MELSRFLSVRVPYVRRSVLYAKFYAYNGNGRVGQKNTGAGERVMKISISATKIQNNSVLSTTYW